MNIQFMGKTRFLKSIRVVGDVVFVAMTCYQVYLFCTTTIAPRLKRKKQSTEQETVEDGN